MINVIFDIDGTLVDTDGFDGELYIQAVQAVHGSLHIHDNWNMYEHVTDTGCLKQILKENGKAVTEEAILQVRNRFGQLIKEHLDVTPCHQIPGAASALSQIISNPRFSCGIATGGWGHTANMKLQSANIDASSIPLFSSDHHHARSSIMSLCHNNLSQLSDKVVYVGDGLWDMHASTELNWAFIGVGEKLRGKASYWISDFCDPGWMAHLSRLAPSTHGLPNTTHTA